MPLDADALALIPADELRAELFRRSEVGIVITITFTPGEGRGDLGWVIQGDQDLAITYMEQVKWRMFALGAAEQRS